MNRDDMRALISLDQLEAKLDTELESLETIAGADPIDLVENILENPEAQAELIVMLARAYTLYRRLSRA